MSEVRTYRSCYENGQVYQISQHLVPDDIEQIMLFDISAYPIHGRLLRYDSSGVLIDFCYTKHNKHYGWDFIRVGVTGEIMLNQFHLI